MLRLFLTKTVRKGDPRKFALVPFRLDVCPVFWVDYCPCAPGVGASLIRGVFSGPPTMEGVSEGGNFFVRWLIIVCVYISVAKIGASEVPPIFKVGLSHTLRLLG